MHRTFGKIACIKASRPPGSIPELTFERMRLNQSNGIATQLIPDCNVVIDMILAAGSTEKAELAKARLAPFIHFLQSCQSQGITYYLSPFMGLNEMRRSEAALGPSALERFSENHGLTWTDTHPHLKPNLAEVGLVERGYDALSPESQSVLCKTYGPILLMLAVARDTPHLSPLARFRTYLRFYHRIIDVVSVREITIARFVFSVPPPATDPAYETWKNISLNFTGRRDLSQNYPRTFRQLDRTALNGALDLIILDSALLADYKGLDGQRLDTWVVTADLKLAALTDAIHHTDGGTGQTGLFLATQDYRDLGRYWNETQNDMDNLNHKFRPNLKFSGAVQRARTARVVGLAQQGIDGAIRCPGRPLRFSGIQDPDRSDSRPNFLIIPQPLG
ncbi:hypothetical protein QSH46_004670 [Xanthomonas arboricola pv. juglandis]|uniref:Uncharacterized protein n=3 Tax=Xanthomonas arboricola TaxID=56448 RepID=A0A8D6UPA3_9XANT|nr:hypothetical protein [Xanthomonas arboricola]MDN0204920.1 hypothetical protein [Xanthomonas arboricola pv. corylina]MDN0215555.1 hypothetical protein [Xanthomonas arboricola pv. corylina]MDN0219414.1 hypothetical protein [Xanthomonas arboricola pv. juglandis]MDN0223979.1 hypothetical protein [Xanthomonas arboricola pv. juglandis]MDN0228240.1 hypothetical protein [Xanthomonas arboricola pv. juglandis]